MCCLLVSQVCRGRVGTEESPTLPCFSQDLTKSRTTPPCKPSLGARLAVLRAGARREFVILTEAQYPMPACQKAVCNLYLVPLPRGSPNVTLLSVQHICWQLQRLQKLCCKILHCSSDTHRKLPPLYPPAPSAFPGCWKSFPRIALSSAKAGSGNRDLTQQVFVQKQNHWSRVKGTGQRTRRLLAWVPKKKNQPWACQGQLQ